MFEVPQSASIPQSPRSYTPILALALFCLAIIPFLPALHGQFLWDDHEWLANNAAVHAWNGLLTIWNPFVQSLHYYPLMFTTFWIEHKLWGLDPTGYHLVNMILHACSALILWRVLDGLGLRGAWIAALLWAIHPIQVDSVAWISERKNTLSGLFYFLAAWSYLRAANIKDISHDSQGARQTSGLYFLAGTFFIAGLLSKTAVCTLPVALALVVWWKRGKIPLRDIIILSILVLLGLAISAFTAYQEHQVLTAGGAIDLSLNPFERIIIAGRDVWFYIRTLFFPYPLMAIYPRWTYAASSLLNYVPAISAGCLTAILFFLRHRIGRGPFVAFAFFLITLSPTLGFIIFTTMRYTFVADHYQYLACLGILVPLATVLTSFYTLISRRHPAATRWSVVAPGCIVVLLFVPQTLFYARLYESPMKMWQWNVDHNPEAYNAQLNLGFAYLNAHQVDLGSQHIAIALAEQPNDDVVQSSYARICRGRGDYAQAIVHFNDAIQLRPRLGNNYVELGKTYEKMGLPQKAMEAFATAVSVEGNAYQYVAYAEALAKARQFDKAILAYENAMTLAPGDLSTRYDFANLLLDLGRYSEAIQQYQSILKVQDTSPLVWHNLAVAYDQSGQMDLARAAEKKARELDAKLAPPMQSAPAPLPPPLPATMP